MSLAPNNSSAWNYLRGILRATATPFSSVLSFVEPYTRPRPRPRQSDSLGDKKTDTDTEVIDLDNPLPSEFAQLPCVEALEFLADVYEEQEDGKSVESAISVSRFVRYIIAEYLT